MSRRSVLQLPRPACVGALWACLTASAALAQDDPGPYFHRRLPEDIEIDGIVAAPDGSVRVFGRTWTRDLPAVVDLPADVEDSYSHAFVIAIERDGSVRWSSILDRFPDGSGGVAAAAVAPDGSTWLTASGQIPSVGGPPPGFREGDPTVRYHGWWIRRIAADGTVAFAGTSGGTGWDFPYGLATTPDGDAVVAGLTTSLDFPVVDATQPLPGGGEMDGFVARIRADGGGLRWSTYLGGPQFDGVTAVTTDASGDVLAVHHERGPGGSWSSIWKDDRILALDLVRIGADGSRISTIPLPHERTGTMRHIVAAADGSVLLAGTFLHEFAWENTGYAMRVVPGSAEPAIVWRSGEWVQGIALTPSGSVVAATDFSDLILDGGSVTLLGSDLRPARTFVASRPDDVNLIGMASTPDGAVWCVGLGRAPLSDPSEEPPTRWTPFVGRLPAPGPAPPSLVRVARAGRRAVHVRWSGDGDPPQRYEIQMRGGPDREDVYRVVAEVPGTARAARVPGLRPGSAYRLRVVPVFANGARPVADVLQVHSRPLPITGLRATPLGASRIHVEWDPHANGEATDYELQRRIGTGPFVTLLRSWLDDDHCPGATCAIDVVAPMEGVGLTYRIRAVTGPRPFASGWTYASAPLSRTPSIRVRQTAGRVLGPYVYPDGSRTDSVEFRVSGTIAVPDGRPAFDVRRNHITMYAGDVAGPQRVHMRPGSWRPFEGAWVWTGDSDDYSYFRVVLDPARGTFEVKGYPVLPDEFGLRAHTVTVIFESAGLVGGDVREWQRAGDYPVDLELR